MWPKENITDLCKVNVRVADTFISPKDDLPRAAAFLNTPKEGTNLSCDWCKYATVEISKNIISKQKKGNGDFKNPDIFRFWNMNVGRIRNEITPNQKVLHEPLYSSPEPDGAPNNRSHSIIEGEKFDNNAEFRVLILQIGEWAV
ncbi:hypothetical protein [Flavobacterium pectinovorum]|nr:hypothetical protein [Flavobacterium pectinovorum]